MVRVSRLAVLAAVLGIAACGSVIVQEPVFTQVYYDGAFEYAASKGELHTEIDGNPLGLPKNRFDALVTATMKGANFGPEVTYTTGRSERTLKPFKVVMLFNAPPSASAIEACAENRKPLSAGDMSGGVSLLSVFCQWGRVLSEAEGTVSGMRGPDDPRFRDLVRQVTASLFPVYDHYDVGGDNNRKN